MIFAQKLQTLCKRFTVCSFEQFKPIIKALINKAKMVGAARFELATPCSQNRKPMPELQWVRQISSKRIAEYSANRHKTNQELVNGDKGYG